MNDFQFSVYKELERLSASGVDVPIESLIGAYHLSNDEFSGLSVPAIAEILLKEGLELSKQNLTT